jgi:hypothetical protein
VRPARRVETRGNARAIALILAVLASLRTHDEERKRRKNEEIHAAGFPSAAPEVHRAFALTISIDAELSGMLHAFIRFR